MKTEFFACWSIGVSLLIAAIAGLTQGPRLETVRVICLPGLPLAVAAAMMHGTFAKRGLEVEAETAPNSDALRGQLASGKFDVAHAAVDNAIATVETAGVDVIIVMGGERSLNELIAQPDIHSIAELRGRTLIVDAPHTAYALQLRRILLLNGLQPGRDCELKAVGATPQRLVAMREHKEYAASILGPPTSLLAKRDGFVSLGSTQELIGPYQGIGAFVRRQWAQGHADTLVRYLAAYIEAQRWLLAPAHKQQVIELLMKESGLSADVAAETYALSVERHGAYEEDARFDPDAFKNVLKLRAEVEGQWGGRMPAENKYYDPSYYQQALSRLPPPQ